MRTKPELRQRKGHEPVALPESGDYTTRPGSPSDRPACLAIGAALPDYFSPAGLVQMAHDLETHEVWVRERAGTIVGYVVVERKVSPVLEILWLAVVPDRHGQGHGTALIETLADQAKRCGIALLEVKTLAATSEWPPYVRTRRFYERRGFMLLDVIDPYPGWSPGNPCALYVRIV